jgi:hypothetical protein
MGIKILTQGKNLILINGKKVGLLLVILLVSTVVKVLAEEVVSTILFEPEILRGGRSYLYPIDSTGNLIIDRHLEAYMTSANDPVFSTLTKYYLKPGVKFIFEDRGLKPFEDIAIHHIIAIEINGRMVELSEMFPPEVVKQDFLRLQEKLVREGRVK